MKFVKGILTIVISILLTSGLYAQKYGPNDVKSFDTKFIRKKILYVPIVDNVNSALKDKTVFRGLKTDKQIDKKWKEIWDEGIKNSTFDMLEGYEIKQFRRKLLEKSKDKTVVVMYFERDFYNNWHANLEVCEPKKELVASTIVNGLKLTSSEDVTLMMNMLSFSMINASNYYGDKVRPLYRNHENKYKESINDFSKNLKSKVFIIPEVDRKEHKKYKKYNDKIEEFLKEEWKFSSFKFLDPDDIPKNLKNKDKNKYYLKSLAVYTGNSKIIYNYYLVVRASDNAVITDYMARDNILKYRDYKYLQDKIEDWTMYFMSARDRREYEQAKEQVSSKSSSSKSGRISQTKKKTTKGSKKK